MLCPVWRSVTGPLGQGAAPEAAPRGVRGRHVEHPHSAPRRAWEGATRRAGVWDPHRLPPPGPLRPVLPSALSHGGRTPGLAGTLRSRQASSPPSRRPPASCKAPHQRRCLRSARVAGGTGHVPPAPPPMQLRSFSAVEKAKPGRLKGTTLTPFLGLGHRQGDPSLPEPASSAIRKRPVRLLVSTCCTRPARRSRGDFCPRSSWSRRRWVTGARGQSLRGAHRGGLGRRNPGWLPAHSQPQA